MLPCESIGINIQTNTVNVPASMPAIAAVFVILLHVKERITKGPNAAPKPAQALLTNDKIVLFSPKASPIAATATTITHSGSDLVVDDVAEQHRLKLNNKV